MIDKEKGDLDKSIFVVVRKKHRRTFSGRPTPDAECLLAALADPLEKPVDELAKATTPDKKDESSGTGRVVFKRRIRPIVFPTRPASPVDATPTAAFSPKRRAVVLPALRATPVEVTPAATHPAMPAASLNGNGGILNLEMRFTAKELAQLQHIQEKTTHSIHEFCEKAIQKALAETLQA